MEENFCSISLYLYGDNISHDEVSKLLGLSPTRVRSRGDVRVTSSGSKVVQKIGLWEYRKRIYTNEISSRAADFIAGINHSKVVGQAGIEKAELDVFVPLGEGDDQNGFSFELHAGLLATLSVLGFDVIITAR
ncbi:DUF4279 domain-containing protein [Glutamicibacter soli]